MKYTEFKKLKLNYDENNLEKFKEKNIIKVKDKRTRLNKNGIYEVYPLAVDNKQIYVICPFCKDIHVHGLVEDTDGTYGGRHPLCIGNKNNMTYYIKK